MKIPVAVIGILNILFAALSVQASDNMKAYSPAAAGMIRHVLANPQPSGSLILDSGGHNPGEPLSFPTNEAPSVIKEIAYKGKIYSLFDSPFFGIDWQTMDPDIFPKGSPGRDWVDQKAARIDAQYAACKAAGIKVYAMGDLIVFPRALVQKYKMEKTFTDPTHPLTDKFLRAMIGQMFDRFPNIDGIVLRIGEIYMQGAPFHRGGIANKKDAQKTIIPLMQLLREEVCVKRNKQLIFRSWMSFDTDLSTYMEISNAIEPHPNLIFAVKHCEADFHRGHQFSKVLGEGRHQQIVEVQCAREYEGKGAYPNYIANGVIEGFEEHRLQMPADRIQSIRQLAERKGELFAGIWTWSRGGGWGGPFIKNGLWCDLNAWVLAQWAKDPTQTEESIFNRYAAEQLKLKGEDITKFRRLCLLSADAVLRGKASTTGDMGAGWSRDDTINRPSLPHDPQKRKRALDQKGEAVRLWEQIVTLAREIQFSDPKTKDYALISSQYGLHLYRIYQAVCELQALGPDGDKEQLRQWLLRYDNAWADYRKLPEASPQCASLYYEKGSSQAGGVPGIETIIPPLRSAANASLLEQPRK